MFLGSEKLLTGLTGEQFICETNSKLLFAPT